MRESSDSARRRRQRPRRRESAARAGAQYSLPVRGRYSYLSMREGNKCGVKLDPPMAPPTAPLMETGGRMSGGERCDVDVTSPRGVGPGDAAAPSSRRLRRGGKNETVTECRGEIKRVSLVL